jgi:AAA15 family ATPase/GTPase
MYLKKLHIKNFKSFQDIVIEFNSELNIFTGINNAGKTTMLEAIALWHECFSKLIQEAKKATTNYKKGDYVLGNTGNKYFPYDQINSVRSPNFEDIFYQRDKKNKIELCSTFEDKDKQTIDIDFIIGQSGLNYVIELIKNTTYDYQKFNDFFKSLPSPIACYYASPVAAIGQKESFATKPQIQQAILNRQSTSVFRNRLYRIYNESSFVEFISDLSYILFDNQQRISITLLSDINQDTDIVFNFKIGSHDVEKDISLLGSGALQIMEILLNFHYSDDFKKDINLVLLDEPDSHIHRDIQHRLLITLTKFTKNTQVFLSTHNESLIRSASTDCLFHLDAKPINNYRPLSQDKLKKQIPHFKGIMPTMSNPVISSLGHSNGLDFVNAIEADYLIFVEGEDDAIVLDVLLKKAVINNKKRYVYWVLGGVSHVFTDIIHYKTVFSSIKNEKTLWDKSVLIFDRDYLDDYFLDKLSERLKNRLLLNTYLCSAYTFEATLFSDINKTARLLKKWFEIQQQISLEENVVFNSLQTAYQNYKATLSNRYDNELYKKNSFNHVGYKNNANKIFSEKPLIDINDTDFSLNLIKHIKDCLDSNQLYKLMRKDDVENVINIVSSTHNISFNIETDFLSLIECVDKSTWLDEWDFLKNLC